MISPGACVSVGCHIVLQLPHLGLIQACMHLSLRFYSVDGVGGQVLGGYGSVAGVDKQMRG